MTNISSGARSPGGIPLNVTLHGWPVPPPEPETKSPAPETDSRLNITARLLNLNATGFVALDEDLDPGFSDGQTLMLAAFGTLLTLIVTVGMILGARLLWRRCRETKDEGYEGVLQREESSEPGRHLIKTSESQFTANSEDQTSPTVLTPKSNGSVITMTLKNNHLIVETEETTQCTSPTVRVDSRGSTTTFVTNNPPDFPTTHESHGVLVHRPADEEDEKQSTQTGLSQSDLSMSSSGSQNLSYRYGNQTAYDCGGYGYSETSNQPALIRPSSQSASREFQDFTQSPSKMDRTDSVVSDSDVNIFLRSDITARNEALERKRLADETDEPEAVADQKLS